MDAIHSLSLAQQSVAELNDESIDIVHRCLCHALWIMGGFCFVILKQTSVFVIMCEYMTFMLPLYPSWY